MVSVHLLPSLTPPGALRGGVAVVIDVLRASTTIVHALAHGCTAVVPCREIDEARRVAAALPRESVLLGGDCSTSRVCLPAVSGNHAAFAGTATW